MDEIELEKIRKQRRESYEHDLRMMCRLVNPHNILEWGPGRSTEIILEELPNCKILTIEHDLNWYQLSMERFADNPNVTVTHKEISLKGDVSEGYVGYPILTKKDYDLVFIDGRHRGDCLALVSLMKNNPYVVIHDAKRHNYRMYFETFKNFMFFEDRNTAILSNRSLAFYKEEKPSWIIPYDVEDTMTALIDQLYARIPFYYMRFGDAEIFTMENPLFANKRHQPKDDALSNELIEAFQIEDVMYMKSFTIEGWNDSKLRKLRRIIGEYVPFGKNVVVPHVSAVHLSFLHHYDLFKKFLTCFQDRKVLLIGGPTCCGSMAVHKAFNVNETITLSNTNAYDVLRVPVTMTNIRTAVKRNDVVLSALGHASTALGKRLYFDEYDIQFIDIGSVVDALAGVVTRGWIKKNIEYVMQKRKEYV